MLLTTALPSAPSIGSGARGDTSERHNGPGTDAGSAVKPPRMLNASPNAQRGPARPIAAGGSARHAGTSVAISHGLRSPLDARDGPSRTTGVRAARQEPTPTRTPPTPAALCSPDAVRYTGPGWSRLLLHKELLRDHPASRWLLTQWLLHGGEQHLRTKWLVQELAAPGPEVPLPPAQSSLQPSAVC